MSYTVYQVGSTTIPFLHFTHDIDYIVIDATEEEKKTLKEKYQSKAKNSNIDAYITHNQIKEREVAYYGLSPYARLVEGEDKNLVGIKIDRNKVIEYCKKFIERYSFDELRDRKPTYHVLLTCFRLNGKDSPDKLSDKEKHWVQLCHDRMMTSEIYEYIKTVLK